MNSVVYGEDLTSLPSEGQQKVKSEMGGNLGLGMQAKGSGKTGLGSSAETAANMGFNIGMNAADKKKMPH